PLITAVAPREAHPQPRPSLVPHLPNVPEPVHVPVTAVVIGVSTGGPNALAQLIPSLGADADGPIFIVQHIPALFTQALAERLDRISDRKIVEASDAEPVVAGRVYIAPGGRHLTLRRVSASRVEVTLDDGAPENSCRPSVDVLFRSAAQAYGAG